MSRLIIMSRLSWRRPPLLRRAYPSAILACAALLSGLLLSVPGHAQQTTTENKPGAQTSEEAARQGGLDVIVVTAQRREQTLQSVPVSVEAISGDKLRAQAITDTTALAGISPSIGFQSGYGGHSSGFMMRGVTSESFEGGIQQSTAMLLDGVPLERPNEFVGDLGDIERVEILRGPSGTLFGKNATAGVVSIFTKRPVSKLVSSVELGETTDDERSARVMLNAPVNDTINTRFNAFYGHLNPLVKNLSHGNSTVGFNSYGFAGKVDFAPSENLNILVSADYRRKVSQDNQSAIITPVTGFAALQEAVLGYTPHRGQDFINNNGLSTNLSHGYSFGTQVDWTIQERLKLTSITSYRWALTDGLSDVDATPIGVDPGKGFTPNPLGYPVQAVGGGSSRNRDQVHYFSEEARLNYSGDRNNAVGGVFAQISRESGRNTVPLIFDGNYLFQNPALRGVLFYNTTATRYRINDDTWAVFGDDTYKLTDAFSVFAGLRYTHESIGEDYSNATFFNPVAGFFNPITTVDSAPPVSSVAFHAGTAGNDLSGRAGIQWQPTPNQNYYFSYNRGYKGSAVDVSRVSMPPNPATGYSPIIAPEKAYSFELGTKQQFLANHLEFSLNLFKQRINNLQQNVLIQGTNTQLLNAGGLASKGVELDFRAHPAGGFTVEGGVAYTDAHYDGDAFLACWTGQTAAQGCRNGSYNINGLQARASYKWRYNLGAAYVSELPRVGLNATLRVDYSWFDKSQQALGDDPLTVEPSREMVDASLIVTTDDGKWQGQIYGKNLTDKFYYSDLYAADNVIARSAGWIPRDFHRFLGFKVIRNF